MSPSERGAISDGVHAVGVAHAQGGRALVGHPFDPHAVGERLALRMDRGDDPDDPLLAGEDLHGSDQVLDGEGGDI